MSEQPWQPLPWQPPSNPYAAPLSNPYAYPPPSNPYAFPPPSHYSYAPSPPAHRARNLVIGGIVLALIVTVVGIEAAHPRATATTASPANQVIAQAPASPSAPAQSTQPNQPTPAPSSDGVTASSVVTPSSGAPVFSDNFTDPDSGWSTGPAQGGDANFAYAQGGYAITSTVAAHWLAYAPYSVAAQQVNLNVTASESAGASANAGFGLLCQRGPDSTSEVRYEFIVNESNRFFIERNEGAVSMSSTPTVLDEGALPSSLGTEDTGISGICATLADGQTTRLMLFVGAKKVADITNVATLDADGWLGGVMSTNGDVGSSTTTFAAYAESSLGNDGIIAANT